ncbi:MAG: methyltransferase type 11, partial [Pseudomonadota bacterium]
MFCLDELCPDWRKGIVHESSPAGRAYSKRLVSQCESYIALQFFPGSEPGSMVKGFRCENLEAMTFEDGSIDVHIHLDVMEHVNFPSR